VRAIAGSISGGYADFSAELRRHELQDGDRHGGGTSDAVIFRYRPVIVFGNLIRIINGNLLCIRLTFRCRHCFALNAADMVDLAEDRPKSGSIEAGAFAADPLSTSDRRRPERREWVNPALLELLRTNTQFVRTSDREPGQSADTHLNEPSNLVDVDPDKDADPLAAGRGIVVGLLISIPIWTMIGLGIRFIF
jgi:hypothetical protein